MTLSASRAVGALKQVGRAPKNFLLPVRPFPQCLVRPEERGRAGGPKRRSPRGAVAGEAVAVVEHVDGRGDAGGAEREEPFAGGRRTHQFESARSTETSLAS